MGISWSAMRKVLEKDNICESLKGRIQYFSTRYHKMHDQEGRVAIRLDGKEIYKSCYYDWVDKLYEGMHIYYDSDIEDMSCLEFDEAFRNKTQDFKGFDRINFYDAFYIYQNSSIDDSLKSANPITRLFAIMDKRVGKRRLQNIIPETKNQPEWLQVFYLLRLEADGVIKSDYQQKRAN